MEAMDYLDKSKNDQDVVKLLELVQNICHRHDKTKQSTMALVKLDKSLYMILQ